jgi:nucleoid DNA-binding protein
MRKKGTGISEDKLNIKVTTKILARKLRDEVVTDFNENELVDVFFKSFIVDKLHKILPKSEKPTLKQIEDKYIDDDAVNLVQDNVKNALSIKYEELKQYSESFLISEVMQRIEEQSFYIKDMDKLLSNFDIKEIENILEAFRQVIEKDKSFIDRFLFITYYVKKIAIKMKSKEEYLKYITTVLNTYCIVVEKSIANRRLEIESPFGLTHLKKVLKEYFKYYTDNEDNAKEYDRDDIQKIIIGYLSLLSNSGSLKKEYSELELKEIIEKYYTLLQENLITKQHVVEIRGFGKFFLQFHDGHKKYMVRFKLGHNAKQELQKLNDELGFKGKRRWAKEHFAVHEDDEE